MKRFNSSKEEKEKEDLLDESSLSPWQKENLIFLKNNKHQDYQEDKEQGLPTRIEVQEGDIFSKPQLQLNENESSKVKQYVKPTDINDQKSQVKENDLEQEGLNDIADFEERDSDGREVDTPHELLELEKSLIKPQDKKKLTSEDQPKRQSQFSKKVKYQVAIFVSILLLVLSVAIYYATPLSKVGEVSVTGTQLLSSQGIEKVSHLKKGQPLWKTYSKRKAIEKEIKKAYPGIQSVNITLSGLHKLDINVKEYPLSGYLIVDKIKYSPILSNGVILSQTIKKKPSDVLYAKFKSGKFLSEVMKSYQKIPRETRMLIQQITYTPSKGNDQLVLLYMRDGNQVKVSGTEMAEKMKYYNQISKQMADKGIIDMEVGVYSYPYGNEDTERKQKQNVADGVIVSDSQSLNNGSATLESETPQEIIIPDN